jgi:uncharacterized protein YndB with AHSA1/START domain
LHDTHVLTLSRVLDARRERIFELLTDPTELARWWGPRGFTTPEIEVDLRVGGHYRFAMQPPAGEVFHLSGHFLEVNGPSRLAYTFWWEEPHPDDRETVVELTLEAERDTTVLSLRHGEFATDERLALHRGGWTDSLDRLHDVVATGGGPGG